MIIQNDKQVNENSQEAEHQSSATTNKYPANIVINNQLPEEGKSKVETLTAIAGVFIAIAVAFSGCQQYKATTEQQKSDRADQDRETKEQVLTDYGKTIQELFVTRNPSLFDGDQFPVNEAQTDIARGHTLIALRRLNPQEKPQIDNGGDSKGDEGVFNSLLSSLSFKPKSNENEDDESKADSGRLKGLLIRYLYEAELIGLLRGEEDDREPVKPHVDLRGADLRNVSLDNAWLPGISLQNAELSDASFSMGNLIEADLSGADLSHATLIGAILTNADLSAVLDGANNKPNKFNSKEGKPNGANLSSANLRFADLRGVDLRYANLKTAILGDDTKLTGACYVKGTEAEFFPPDFKPAQHGMIAIPEDKSNPTQPNFKPCPTVSLSSTP